MHATIGLDSTSGIIRAECYSRRAISFLFYPTPTAGAWRGFFVGPTTCDATATYQRRWPLCG